MLFMGYGYLHIGYFDISIVIFRVLVIQQQFDIMLSWTQITMYSSVQSYKANDSTPGKIFENVHTN